MAHFVVKLVLQVLVLACAWLCGAACCESQHSESKARKESNALGAVVYGGVAVLLAWAVVLI